MTEPVLRRCRRNPQNPLVFFDIDIGTQRAGKIIFELFSDVVPKVMPCIYNRHAQNMLANHAFLVSRELTNVMQVGD